ncbi:MAG: GNAT family N-acetyltransferase [Armatimonadetes bacterium]|nr:GNAT family N-acetyltransferase [Armatimonadota bacterium]
MIEQDVSARLNPALIELQREVLNSGHPLKVRLYGMSMYPFIRPGDVTVIRAVNWTDLRRGDVVFYERESRLVAHRVLIPPFDADSPLIAKGDTLENYDPPVRPDQLMGRVEALERGKRIVSLVDRRGRWVQIVAAEISGPYSTLFWKVAAWRRRTLRMLLNAPAYRRRRRTSSLEGKARLYAPHDIDHLANCLWDLQPQFNFAQMRDWTARQIDRLNDGGVSLWVMEEGRRLVGVALLHPPDGEGQAALTDLYIHPLTRGYGFGEQLLDAVEVHAAAQGASALAVSLPSGAKAARNLLRKRGWSPSGSFAATPADTFLRQSGESRTVWTRDLEPLRRSETAELAAK